MREIPVALWTRIDPAVAAGARWRVNCEFDRIARTFRSAIERQSSPETRAEIEVALALFEAKRGAGLNGEQLQYLLQGRDVVDEQTCRIIVNDVRYQAIKSIRTIRSEPIRASYSNAALG